MSPKKSVKKSKSNPNNNSQQPVAKGKRANLGKKSTNANNTSLETLKRLSDLSSYLDNEPTNELLSNENENGSIDIQTLKDLKQRMNRLNLQSNGLVVSSLSAQQPFVGLLDDCSNKHLIANSSQFASNLPNLNFNQSSKSRLPSYVANGLTVGYKQPSSNYQLHQSMSSNNFRSDSRLSNSSLVPTQVCSAHNSHLTSRCSNTNKKSSPGQCSGSNSMHATPSTSSPTTPSESRRSSKMFKKTNNNANQSTKMSKMNKTFRFEEYMPLCKVQNMLGKGQIVEGVLRINPRNFEDAYISAPAEGEIDIRVYGKQNINRAFNNDHVAVELRPVNEWNIMYNVIQANWSSWKDEIIDILQAKKTRLENKLNNLCLEGETINFDETINLASNQDYKSNTIEEEPEDTEEDGCLNDSEHYESAQEDFDVSRSNYDDRIYLTEEFFPDDKQFNLNMSIENKIMMLGDKTATVVIERSVYNADGVNLKSLKPEDLIRCSFHKRCLQQTGKVVHILRSSSNKTCGGRLRPQSTRSEFVVFETTDKRMPNFLIPVNECPADFSFNPQFYQNSLFLGQIRKWPATSKFPFGRLIKMIGCAGEIEAETEILLAENNVDTSDFPSNVENGLPITPGKETYDIPVKEIKKRRDIRNECVFTIDPATARDLDDALSVKKISKHSVEGKEIFEVGVHIADVSYFVKDNLPIDQVAKHRTTSIYCVQKVIPMLPRILCEKYCSLNPGEDKLTFSVFWHMNAKGEIVKEWFERTVIKSCIKLSYDIAADMIDKPDFDWNDSPESLPELHNSNFDYNDVARAVNLMAAIATNLRAKRFKHGSLEITKPEVRFVLDETRSNVLGFTTDKPNSTFLVEEFMLLANISVAKKIYSAFPSKSFLRRHPMPEQKMIKDFEDLCINANLDMSTATSKQLQSSLNEIKEKIDNDSYRFLSLKLLKTLRPAEYFSTMKISNYNAFQHYALCVPIYTHFTSPIRRYPDIIVHRLLAASLNLEKEPKFKRNEIDLLVERCNEMKLANRIVSETSQKLFLSAYILSIGHIVQRAIVMQVFDQAFDCFLTKLNVTIRIYCNQLDLDHVEHNHLNDSLKLFYNSNPQHYVLIKILTKVNLKLTIPDKAFLLKWHAMLV